MIEIIPAILPKTYEDLKNKIALVRGHVPIVQIDICDGIFVKNTTWPFSNGSDIKDTSGLDMNFKRILDEQEGMPFWEDIDFELDLMVMDAVDNFDIYSKLGAKRMVFHVEAVGNLGEFNNFLEGMDVYTREAIELGISLNIQTPLEKIFPLIGKVDFVQFMDMDNVGFQAQKFNEKVLEHIKTLKEKFPDVRISVDGGVNFENAPLILESGVSSLVIGSSIFNSEDIIGTIEEFKNLR